MSDLIERPSLLSFLLNTLLQRKTNNTQDSLRQESSSPQRPKNDDREGWRDYWVQMGQP